MRDQGKKKKAGIRDWIYRLVMLILIGIMLFSGYKIISIKMEYSEGTKAYEELAHEMDKSVKKPGSKEPLYLDIDWEKLAASNNRGVDVRYYAWIRMKGTTINYPIVQTYDNESFLRHLLTGEYNMKGTIFIDYRVEAPFSDFNTVVYGHNMKDGTMFSDLQSYIESEGYFDKHKTLELYTPNQDYDLVIFGGMLVNAFNKTVYNFYFPEGEDYLRTEMIDWIKNNNQIPGFSENIDVTAADKIVTLSTCTNVAEDDRYVIFCKLVPVTRKK